MELMPKSERFLLEEPVYPGISMCFIRDDINLHVGQTCCPFLSFSQMSLFRDENPSSSGQVLLSLPPCPPCPPTRPLEGLLGAAEKLAQADPLAWAKSLRYFSFEVDEDPGPLIPGTSTQGIS